MKEKIGLVACFLLVALFCMSCATNTSEAPSKIRVQAIKEYVIDTVNVDPTDENDVYKILYEDGQYVTLVDQVEVTSSAKEGVDAHETKIVKQRLKNLELINNSYSGEFETWVEVNQSVNGKLVFSVRVDPDDEYDNYPIYLKNGYYRAVVDGIEIKTADKAEIIDLVLAQRRANLELVSANN